MYCDILIIMFFPSRNPYLENRKNQHQQKQNPLFETTSAPTTKQTKKSFKQFQQQYNKERFC